MGIIARSRWNFNPLFIDLGLTAATGFIVLVSGLVIVSIFGKTVGAVALGEYLLLRRVYAWLQSASLLGISGALPRYVAHAVDKPRSERLEYLSAALVCGGAVTVCLIGILFSGRAAFARWWFGNTEMSHLIPPLAVLLVGGSAHALAFGYFRGRLAMKRANTLQVLNLGIIPIAAVLALFRTGSAALVVDAMGIGMAICSVVFLLLFTPQLVQTSWAHLGARSLELLRYGIPRLPAAFALGALFAAGPMIAAHYLPLVQVTYLLLGMSLLMGVSASAEPLGLILLSKVSMVVARDRLPAVRIYLSYLLAAVVEVYFFICLQLVVFADVVVRAWLGPRFLGGILVIRLCLLAIPFYLLFISFRNIIDAATVTAYNAYNIVLSGLAFLAMVAAGIVFLPVERLPESIALSMVLSLVILAWWTERTVRKIYDVGVNWGRSAFPLLLGVLLGVCSFIFHWTQGFRTSFLQFVLLELAALALFFALLRKIGTPWLPFFWNWAFLRQNRGDAVLLGQGS